MRSDKQIAASLCIEIRLSPSDRPHERRHIQSFAPVAQHEPDLEGEELDEYNVMKQKKDLPLVYSCSGCSSAAQLANHVAIRMDRTGYAEMSCIAGVGGDVPSLVRVAKSGRPIIAIDGCVLACVKHSLGRHGVVPAVHHELSKIGVKKRYGMDFEPDDASRVFDQIILGPLPQDGSRQSEQVASA